MEKIIENKYFKLIKLILGSLVIFASIFALTMAWYASRDAQTIGKNTVTTVYDGNLRVLLMVSGFIGVGVGIFSLVNVNKPIPVIVGFSLTIVFLILLLSLSFVVMGDVEHISVLTPVKTP